MAPRALPSGYHLALSVSQDLWSDLLREALPVQVGTGEFDVIESGRKLLHAAEDQVKGLLTGVEQKLDDAPVLGNPRVRGIRTRARHLARKGRDAASTRFRDSVRVTGKWHARVAREGSQFTYRDGGVTLDARAVLELEGRAVLFNERFEVPFRLSRNVDGTASLDQVVFDKNRKQLQGTVNRVSLSLGESLPLRLLKILGERLLEKQVDKINPVPLIPASSLESMLTPGQGPLKFSAGIDDLSVGISGQDLTLSVRFAFRGGDVAA